MAKKMTKVTSAPTPEGEVESAGKLFLVPLSRIRINEAIAAREGDPDPEKVGRFAENFIERRSYGKDHQISPAIVRSIGDDLYELIDGRHRFEACKQATEAAKEDYNLLCRVVKADDEAGLVDAIQSNEFRETPNDFDRASSIEKLIALGKTQAECATIFGLSEPSISQIRAVGRLDKKYRKAIESGDLERDAAILIAGLTGPDGKPDEAARNEVFEEAIRHKNKLLEAEARMETKRLRRLADEKVEEAKAKVTEAKEVAKEKAEARRTVEKELKEVTSSASKTKDVDELIAIRNKEKELKAQADALAKEEKEHAEAAEKANKLVEKAKAEKEKIKEQTAAKKPVTQEDAKNIAAEKGAKTKGGSPVKASPKNAKQFKVEMEAIAEDKNNPVPKAVIDLMGKIEAFIDGDIVAKTFRDALVFYCKTDEQLTEAVAAKKRKK